MAEGPSAASASAPTQRMVVVALRDDAAGREALQWALKECTAAPGHTTLFLLLHIVSDVPNAQMKSVRVSEADFDRVAVHLRDRVLPFLESMQDICDHHEVMSSIEVVKDDLRPEAIIDSAIRLQADTLVLGGSENTTTWGTIAHCTALGKTPPNCRVIVVTNGRKSKEISHSGELVALEEYPPATSAGPASPAGSFMELQSGESVGKSASSAPSDPPRSNGLRGVSLFSGKKRSKTVNGKMLVKQRSEERSYREEENSDSGFSSQDSSPVRFAASLLSQLSIGRAAQASYSPPRKGGESAGASPCPSPFGSGRPHPPPLLPSLPRTGPPCGRITLFSSAGCKNCQAVRSLFRSKGAAYVDISLDAYPERRHEMEARSHKTTTPQIFFNSEHIGDNESLQALEQQGELDAMIEDVYDREAPPSSPLPPEATPGSIRLAEEDSHALLVRRLKAGISVQDRLFAFHVYHSCFVGSDAVEWLKNDQKLTKEEALSLGNKLMAKHFFHHVTRERRLEDTYQFYKFLGDSGVLTKGSCLNFTGTIWSGEIRRPAKVVAELAGIMQSICDEYVAEDGRWVDYRALAESALMRRYIQRSEELQRMPVECLSREERLALFLNSYNMMVLQVVSFGPPFSGQVERLKLFSKYVYLIGGCFYSLVDIENGILRGNRKPLNSMSRPFSSKDPRLRVAMPDVEPLIHFALTSGTRSSPALRVYYPESIMPQLRASARTYLQDEEGLQLDTKARQIALSKTISWYEKDFGKSGYDVLIWIAQQVEDPRRSELLTLARDINTIAVLYVEYDWTRNLLLWR